MYTVDKRLMPLWPPTRNLTAAGNSGVVDATLLFEAGKDRRPAIGGSLSSRRPERCAPQPPRSLTHPHGTSEEGSPRAALLALLQPRRFNRCSKNNRIANHWTRRRVQWPPVRLLFERRSITIDGSDYSIETRSERSERTHVVANSPLVPLVSQRGF